MLYACEVGICSMFDEVLKGVIEHFDCRSIRRLLWTNYLQIIEEASKLACSLPSLLTVSYRAVRPRN